MTHATPARIDDGTFTFKTHTDQELADFQAPPTTSASIDPSGLITVITADGHVFEYQPEDHHRQAHPSVTPKAITEADGTVKLIWATYDEEPGDFDFLPGDSFREFAGAAARDAYIERHVANGPAAHLFLVDRYDRQDGTVDYRCASVVHKNRQIAADSPPFTFVETCGVFILDAASEQDAPLDAARVNLTMGEYAQYTNGEVYGIGTASFTADGDLADDEQNDVWKIVGTTFAQTLVDGGGF